MGRTKTFHLSDILSVSTGTLVSRDHIGGVYNVLNHMTEDNLYTHQLLLAAPVMRPELERQFPWLKDITAPELQGEAECVAWVASVAAVHGEYHEVESAPSLWGKHDPLTDLTNINPEARIIAVALSDDERQTKA